jgi:hypothetical protein
MIHRLNQPIERGQHEAIAAASETGPQPSRCPSLHTARHRRFASIPRTLRAGLWSALLAVMALCGSVAVAQEALDQRPRAIGGAFIDRFGAEETDSGAAPRLDRKAWFIARYDNPSPGFRTSWRREGVSVGPDGLTLSLRPSPDGPRDFVSGEVQRPEFFHHGRYEAVMTPARGHGLVTGFFTYTGGYFRDSHDEIDFEFLGRDTTQVQVNIWRKGRQMPGKLVDLGFDAADAPHLYAFEWTEEGVVWFVDGREVYRVAADHRSMPIRPGKIYVSLLAGNEAQANWSGTAPDDATGRAVWRCISYQPIPDRGTQAPQCSDIHPPEQN